MTTQTVSASIMLNTGEIVDLSSTLTDGTEGELLSVSKARPRHAEPMINFIQLVGAHPFRQVCTDHKPTTDPV